MRLKLGTRPLMNSLDAYVCNRYTCAGEKIVRGFSLNELRRFGVDPNVDHPRHHDGHNAQREQSDRHSKTKAVEATQVVRPIRLLLPTHGC